MDKIIENQQNTMDMSKEILPEFLVINLVLYSITENDIQEVATENTIMTAAQALVERMEKRAHVN